MVTIASLWLPILIAAVLVFVVSSIIHMVLKYHKSDFGQVPSEDAVMDALRQFDIPPGDYVVPCARGSADMKSPEFTAKVEKGPVVFMTVLPKKAFDMGSSMLQWFIYCVVVGIFAAYLSTLALERGADYMEVMQVAGTTAFLGYGLALLTNSIWYKRQWSATLKSLFDALVYGLVTGGTLGAFWPGLPSG